MGTETLRIHSPNVIVPWAGTRTQAGVGQPEFLAQNLFGVDLRIADLCPTTRERWWRFSFCVTGSVR